MEKVDMNKLEVAIKYVQRIADGYHPVSNVPMEEDAVLNNPNVIRCMFFIKEVLEEVYHNDGMIAGKKAKAKKEPFPFEILREFQYQEDKSISHLLAQVHAPIEGMDIKKISPQTVTTWLKSAGYLTIEYCVEVKKESTIPTEKGKALGIYSEVREYGNNTYLIVLYNQRAQEFIVENLEKIVNGEIVEE